MQNVTGSINFITDRIYDALETRDRILVGLCGAPGSGKSTLAEELYRRLTAQKTLCRVVPMDGFHLDNSVIEQMGLLNRKGAPETFDAAGYVHLVRRIAGREQVFAPTFDRSRDIAIAGAMDVPAHCPVVIFEGNYLLLNEHPWDQLMDLFDLTVFLDVDMPELRARLIHRWLSHGLSRAAATRRAEANDLLNAERVAKNSHSANIVLH